MAPRIDGGAALPIHFHFHLKVSGQTEHRKIVTAAHICVFLKLLYRSDRHMPVGVG